MKHFGKISLSAFALLTLLFFVAGRPLGELLGLVRASADVTVDGLVDGVPTEVTDRMLDHDVRRQRSRMTEHQIALNLSRRQIDTLQDQVTELEERAARRQRLLAEAYPVLQRATDENLETVQFAATEHTLADFQVQVDGLLAEEERESQQLEIRRAGLTKLTASVADGERAMAEMRNALLSLEQEIDVLRTRRDQAELEARTLDLVSTVDAAPNPAATRLGAQADKLRNEVDRLEAGNEARRASVPASGSSNRLSQDWQRLERLRAIHEANEADSEAPGGQAPQQAGR